jgi:hypothetical protein
MDYEGYRKIGVVQEDSCGLWFAIESHGYFDRHRWLLYLQSLTSVANGGSVDVVQLVHFAIWESNADPPDLFEVSTREDKGDVAPGRRQVVAAALGRQREP